MSIVWSINSGLNIISMICVHILGLVGVDTIDG
jgi:hypothetical protein